jgi:short-subunit dehydrogenase
LAEDAGAQSLQQATADLDLGLLVASAGFGTSGAFLENSLEPEFEMLNVNCRSLMELSWHFGRRFEKRGGGGIILMSSIVSFQGTPWSAHYSATKAYVQVLAEGLRAELKPKNVDVLAVAPGPTKTGFAAKANMKMGAALDPRRIAPEILNALGRKTTVLPGFLSKLLVYAMFPLPRWARIAIMGKVMRGMAAA